MYVRAAIITPHLMDQVQVSSCTERRAVDSCAETVLLQGNDCPFNPYVHTQSEILNVFSLCDLGRKVTQDRRTITGRLKKGGGDQMINPMFMPI